MILAHEVYHQFAFRKTRIANLNTLEGTFRYVEARCTILEMVSTFRSHIFAMITTDLQFRWSGQSENRLSNKPVLSAI